MLLNWTMKRFVEWPYFFEKRVFLNANVNTHVHLFDILIYYSVRPGQNRTYSGSKTKNLQLSGFSLTAHLLHKHL